MCKVDNVADIARMVTPIQKSMIDRIVQGYVGDKTSEARAGRCNVFYVLYAWSITAVMDPENHYKWQERVGKYLD